MEVLAAMASFPKQATLKTLTLSGMEDTEATFLRLLNAGQQNAAARARRINVDHLIFNVSSSAFILATRKHCVSSALTFCLYTLRVGQNHTCIGIYGVHTVFLAGKSPYIRSYTVQIYCSGQPYTH